MDILVTGRLASITGQIGEALKRRHKVVYASDDLVSDRLPKGITPFSLAPGSREFERIFHSYHFDVVIFFAQPIFAGEEYYGEYKDLENCLRICADRDVNRFIYVRPALQGEGQAPEHDLNVLFASCDLLCDYYRRRRGMSILVCHTPLLYGMGESASLPGGALRQAKDRGSVQFRGGEKDRVGLLYQADLGELLLRVAEDWNPALTEMEVPAGDVLSFLELGALLKMEYPALRLSYKPAGYRTAEVLTGEVPKREYDWVPVTQLTDLLPGLIRALEGEQGQRASFLQKCRDFLKRHKFIVRLVELILGFLLMELLNRVTATTIQFQYVDFRLLYIVLLGTLHGMKTGLAAAGLASISLLASMIVNQPNWYVTAYDMENWLPFIFYFLIGGVTGYVKDRLRNDNRFLSEEKALLEERYVLLNEFYMSALQNKDQYKMQIMSYRDSFGRLFDITQNLDSTLVDEVFNEALHALEGVLDNKSVCLYSCDEKLLFGRLVACSREIRSTTEKSVNLSKLEKMTVDFADGEVWVNRERLLGYPEYAVPIYREGKPIALIFLWKASFEQLAVYYENLVKIICGLVKMALVHALEYTEQTEKEIYLEGTPIVRNEYFSQILQVKEEMAQEGTSEYSLIQFHTTPENRSEVAGRIAQVIRSTDILGMGSDGELYLCLSQTNQDSLPVVLERIKGTLLPFREMQKGEAI